MRIALLLAALLPMTIATPQGATESVCGSMLPFHNGGIPAMTTVAPYVVDLLGVTQVNQGSKLTVYLRGATSDLAFKGFMIHARAIDPPNNVVGTFTPLDDQVKTISCGTPGSTATHSSTSLKRNLELVWNAPDNFLGRVFFNSTVAQGYDQFWVGVESTPVEVVPKGQVIVPPPGGISTTHKPITTTPPNYTPVTEPPPKVDDPFYTGCGTNKNCFGFSPNSENCVASQDCTSAVAILVQGETYQFELKGTGSPAYVAVGLSNDNKMGDDSVTECVSTGNAERPIQLFMSWTTPRPSLGSTRVGIDQSGVQLLSGSNDDGTIYCKFTRNAVTTVNGQTFDLINTKYHLVLAAGESVEANKINVHTLGKEVTGEPKFLSDIAGFTAASKLLLRLHGAFMLTAWVGTASIGILLARYFKQTWVGSQLCGKDQWFAWHRGCMVLTWTLTVVGFILIFVEIKGWSSEQNPHAVLGVITTALCFIQPIGAFFRPHPGTSKRPIFNWLHWLIGNLAHILAIVTIFFAVKLSKAELPDWMDWILVAFVAFHVFMHFILSISGCVSDRQASKRVNTFPMKDMATSRGSIPIDRKQDAPHSALRKFLLGFYLVAIIIIVVALVVIIVMAPIEKSWNTIQKSIMSTK